MYHKFWKQDMGMCIEMLEHKLYSRYGDGRMDQRQQMSCHVWHEMFPNPLNKTQWTSAVNAAAMTYCIHQGRTSLPHSFHDRLKPTRTFPLILLQWLVLYFIGDRDVLLSYTGFQTTQRLDAILIYCMSYKPFIWPLYETDGWLWQK